ncbi:hypothetical protein [Kitasatospora viridis]|uniref:PknH-like protein n=1 Tax=Kitasatospora viridis TaxID=281105 RepID=A0A561SAN0_9ACTN|nr:hypothetical protein [Kitasatospora viridis]TWF71855.1 hypothetical protein FHX73_1752 [Kitasatospora viridis]
MRKTLLRLGFGMACLALATGCSAGRPSSAAPSTVNATSSPAAGSERAAPELPIERYTLSPDQSFRIAQAKSVLLSSCARSFGIAYTETLTPPAPAPSRRYGVTDDSNVQQFGYHMPDAPGPGGASPSATRPALPQDQSAVVFGGPATQDAGHPLVFSGKPVPPGGCTTEAADRFKADAAAYTAANTAAAIDTSSFHESQQAPAVVHAIAGWSNCMKTKGFDYRSPLDAMGSSAFDTATPSAAELRTAAADVSCKDSTGLVRIWSSVETDMQNKLIAQQQAQLNTLAQAQQHQLATAENILAGAS